MDLNTFTTLPKSKPLLLTEKQASEIMGIAVQTLRNWRAQGRGPSYVKLGKAVRYPLEAIEKFVGEHTIEPRKAGN